MLVTGTGTPVWLPHVEPYGPSGAAVLARMFAALGVRTCVLSEQQFLPGVQAAVQAGGTPLLAEDSWRQRSNAARCLPFPTGKAAAGPFVQKLLQQLPDLAAAFFVEIGRAHV